MNGSGNGSTPGQSEDTGIPPWLLLIMDFIIPYLLAFLIPVGIAGNLCSIYIFIHNRKKDSVSAQYLSLLAFSDCMTIANMGIPIWLYINLETVSYGKYKSPKNMPSDLGCQIGGYIWNVGVYLSGWIVTLFSLERCLVIWKPLKMAPIVSASKPRKIMLLIVVIIGLVSYAVWIPWHKLVSVHEGEEPTKCFYVLPENMSRAVAEIQLFFQLGLPFIVPLILITILNILILIGTRRSRMSNEAKSGGKDNSKQDSRMLRNLLLVSAFYIIFNSAFAVSWWVAQAFERETIYLTPQQRRVFNKVWLTADSLHYFNFCVNPFVYTFSLDYYQATLKRIFCRCFFKSADKK